MAAGQQLGQEGGACWRRRSLPGLWRGIPAQHFIDRLPPHSDDRGMPIWAAATLLLPQRYTGGCSLVTGVLSDGSP